MVQLSSDCFAFGGSVLSLSQAQTALRIAAKPILAPSELCNLDKLAGRVLSKDVFASRDVPPFNNSAVDGYAFAAGSDLSRGIIGTVSAGDEIPAQTLSKNSAMRILTGAPLPSGADTVMMDEDAIIEDNQLAMHAKLGIGSNVRPKGEDITKDEKLYQKGHLVTALDVARLAAGGVRNAEVIRPLKIHVMSSGDEIINDQIIDANRWIIKAVFPESCFELSYGATIADDHDSAVRALKGIDADIVLTSGGVSVGERDFVRGAIEHIGKLEFWRVGIKPGRPVAFGRLNKKCAVFGLPGNPVACFVTALFLARPFALAMLDAQSTIVTLSAPLAQEYRKKGNRTEFLRVMIDEHGSAHPYHIAGAGVISSIAQAHALAILSEELTLISEGSTVPILPLRGLVK